MSHDVVLNFTHALANSNMSIQVGESRVTALEGPPQPRIPGHYPTIGTRTATIRKFIKLLGSLALFDRCESPPEILSRASQTPPSIWCAPVSYT
jgi:hypothetical protein